MYQYNNPNNDPSHTPLPSARMPARPRFNGGGEEYSMQQTSYNGNMPTSPGFQQPPPQDNTDLGYYESSMPGTNMQRPLMGANNNSSISTATTLGGNGGGGGGGGGRFGSPPSNMIGGGPGDFGIAPRRQTRRYKTGKQ